MVSIRHPGKKEFQNQVYHIEEGEGTKSPAYWNGENIRGSGGAPYQRMVPGSLVIYSKERTIQYICESDYICDYYWGTIKRHPEGQICVGEEQSLDYSVWLCRYDAIVINNVGKVCVVEGNEMANESRELLLPEPTVIAEGYLLAHVFTGWGMDCVYNGGSCISNQMLEMNAGLLPMPNLSGRYADMTARTYYVEVQENGNAIKLTVR